MKENRFSYGSLWRIYSPEIPAFITRLAQTPPMLRLTRVGMNCGCEYVALHSGDMCRRYTRFEHSMGVALLVWHFTHEEKQAIAGLFHDISTPAFAHVVDFLNGDHLTQESTESRTADMIAGSPEIQEILLSLGLCTSDVCDYHLYPIADNDSPQLSADRLEYTFGNFIQYGVCGINEIRSFFRAMSAGTNERGEPEIILTDRSFAEQFALRSMKCSKIYVSDADRFTMQYLADILKYGTESGALTVDDLYTTEENVIAKIRNDPSLRTMWSDYTGISGVVRTEQKVPEKKCFRVDAKRRYLDPYVQGAGRVTEFSRSYREMLDEFLSVSFDEWLSEA